MKSRSEVCEERGEASSPRPPSPLARLPVGHSFVEHASCKEHVSSEPLMTPPDAKAASSSAAWLG